MEESTPFILVPELVFPPSALARIPRGVTPDTLLKASVRDDDLSLQLDYPLPDAQEPGVLSDVLQLVVNGLPVGDVIDLRPFLPGDILNITLYAADRPLSSTVDQLITPINYKVTYRAGGGTELGPVGQQFITDIVRPGRDSLGPLVFAADVITDGVTPDKLVDGGPGNVYLPATVKGYSAAAAGDWIDGFIDNDPTLAAPRVEITAVQVGEDVELRFPLALLERIGDGPHSFTYVIEDRAGLVSLFATVVPLQIRLDERIDDLLPPRVPGSSDGLVTVADATQTVDGSTGVIVEIPGHPAIRAGDNVVWWWNTTEFPPVPVTPSQVGADPLMVLIAPYDRVYDDWFLASGDTNLNVVATAGYRIERLGRPLGQSAPARPLVNLFGAGGKDPDPTTPEHESLRPPSVQPGGGGPVNVIPGDAIDQDATAVIPGLTAGVPPVPAFRPGDSVQFYWNNIPVDAPFVITTAGVDVVRTVSKDVLAAHSPGTWNVHYVATRKLVMPPFENAARSPAQAVVVMDAGDVPGGGDPLRKAKWLEGPAGPGRPDHIDRDKAISNGGTPLRIYGYEGMDVGDRFHMVFQGYGNNVPGVDPIPASRYVADYTILANDLVPRLDDSVSPPELAVFFDQNIPTSNLLLIDYGSATFDYTATNAVGSAPAEQAWIYVSTQQ